MAADLGWDEAIRTVLKNADGAVHYAEIAEQIISQKLRKTIGASPASTVAAILSASLRETDSPYVRVGRGEYTLKTAVQSSVSAPSKKPKLEPEASETGAVQSFGMFWRRDLVVWNSNPKLLGRQVVGATTVNFGGQNGVYLLHDRERVVYVGRADGRADSALAARLRVHTTDRLGGRWDRFSWFGLYGVGNESAVLNKNEVPWSPTVVIQTMEALLIESLEPPLNRRRGDNFSGAEYLQVSDPSIEKDKKLALFDELKKSLSAP